MSKPLYLISHYRVAWDEPVIPDLAAKEQRLFHWKCIVSNPGY